MQVSITKAKLDKMMAEGDDSMLVKTIELQPGYVIKYYESKKKDGSFSICGELVKSGTVIRTASRSVKNADQVPYKEDQIKSYFFKLITSKTASTHVVLSKSQLIDALDSLRSTGDIIRYEWSTSTQETAYADFKRFSPAIQYAVESGDIESLQKSIEETVREHGNSKNAATVDTTVHSIMFRLAVVYNELRARYPYLFLPEIDIAPLGRATHRQDELPKMLPEHVRQAFLRELEARVATDPARVKSAVAMTLGARTAEACAADADDITFSANGCTVAFCAQMKGSKKVGTLKTLSSYRVVPGTKWHAIVLQKCIEASKALEVSLLADPKDTAKSIKKILIECGMSGQMIREAEHDMSLISDEAADLSAYILRRDFASLAKNVMGLSSFEIDMLLGHKNYSRKVAHPDLRNPAELDRIRAAMERYIYSVNVSGNPSISPVKLRAGSNESTIPYGSITAVNSSAEPIHVVIDAIALEPAENISFTGNHPTVTMTARSVKAPTSRTNRIII